MGGSRPTPPPKGVTPMGAGGGAEPVLGAGGAEPVELASGAEAAALHVEGGMARPVAEGALLSMGALLGGGGGGMPFMGGLPFLGSLMTIRMKRISADCVVATRGTDEIRLYKPIWFSDELGGLLKCEIIRPVGDYTVVVCAMPQTAAGLPSVLHEDTSAFERALRSLIPKKASDVNGWSINRSLFLKDCLKYHTKVQCAAIPQAFAQQASDMLVNIVVRVLSTHALFLDSETYLRTFLYSREGPDKAMLALVHQLDKKFIVAANAYGSARAEVGFEDREWDFGETAAEYLQKVVHLGRIELKKDDEMVRRWCKGVSARVKHKDVYNQDLPASIHNNFVNVRAGRWNDVNELVSRVAGDTSGGVVLQEVERGNQRARRGTTLLNQATEAELQREIKARTETEEPPKETRARGEAYVTSTGKVVRGYANFVLWAKYKLCPEAMSVQPRRVNVGLDCYWCKNEGYTKEQSFDEYEKETGYPPYAARASDAKRPPPEVVIKHHEARCWNGWKAAVDANEAGTVPDEALEPISQEEYKKVKEEGQANRRSRFRK